MWLMWLEKAKEVKAKGTQRLYESNRSNWVYAQLSDQRHRAAESMDGQRNTRISKSSHCAGSLLLGWLISLKQPSSTRFSSKACWGIPKCLSVWYGFWNPKHPLQPELPWGGFTHGWGRRLWSAERCVGLRARSTVQDFAEMNLGRSWNMYRVSRNLKRLPLQRLVFPSFAEVACAIGDTLIGTAFAVV